MSQLTDKYSSVYKYAKTLGCKNLSMKEDGGRLVIEGALLTPYLTARVQDKAKETDPALSQGDLTLNLSAELQTTELNEKYGPVYQQALTLGCKNMVLQEEGGALTVSANCPTQYIADQTSSKAKKIDAERSGLVLNLAVERKDIYGEYKLKADDTLETVAKKIAKGKLKPEQILEANKDVITDPNSLPVGKKVKIPNWEVKSTAEVAPEAATAPPPLQPAAEVVPEAATAPPQPTAEVAPEAATAPPPLQPAAEVAPEAATAPPPPQPTAEVAPQAATAPQPPQPAAQSKPEAPVQTVAESPKPADQPLVKPAGQPSAKAQIQTPAKPADQTTSPAKGESWKSLAAETIGNVAKAIGKEISEGMKSFNTQVKRGTLVNRDSGKELKVGGYKADRKDPKAPEPKKHSPKKLKASDLPPSADLRKFMTPVEDQGELSSCVGNSVVGAYEYLLNRYTGQTVDVSRLFVYYNARALDGDTKKDEGTFIANAVNVLHEKGTCFESTWPYNPKVVNREPSQSAYNEAAYLMLKDAVRVDLDKDSMRLCLAEGFPICFGIEIFESFQKVGKRGRVSIPDPSNEQSLGGHAMLCVGYSDPDQVFIVRNSWGPGWGDKGYCYIPYDYFLNPEYNGDCWSILSIDKGPALYDEVSDPARPHDPIRPHIKPSPSVVDSGGGSFDIFLFFQTFDFTTVEFFDFSKDIWQIDSVSIFDYVEYDVNEGLELFDISYRFEEIEVYQTYSEAYGEATARFNGYSEVYSEAASYYEEYVESLSLTEVETQEVETQEVEYKEQVEVESDEEEEEEIDEEEEDSDEEEEDSDEEEEDSDEEEEDSDEEEEDSDEEEEDSDEEEEDSDEEEEDSDEEEEDSDEEEEDSDEEEEDSDEEEEDSDEEEEDSDEEEEDSDEEEEDSDEEEEDSDEEEEDSDEEEEDSDEEEEDSDEEEEEEEEDGGDDDGGDDDGGDDDGGDDDGGDDGGGDDGGDDGGGDEE